MLAMYKTKVSVIMSAYNAENYIKEAVDSVLSQSLRNFELIITDDCSTDNTLSIIESYNDERLVIIENKEQNGLTFNLNQMIAIAKGEYIARLDADDVCSPSRLIKQAEFLDENQGIFLVCSYAQAIGDKKGIIKTPVSTKEISATLMFRNPIIHSSVMFRNQGIQYSLDYKKSQDYELWVRLSEMGMKFHTIEEPLVLFRYHNFQISNASKSDQLKYSIQVRVDEIKRLGIDINSKICEQYVKYLENGKIETQSQLYGMMSLLEDIREKNEERLKYDRKAFSKVLKSQYVGFFISIRESENIELKDKIVLAFRARSFLLLKVLVADMIT